MNFSSIGGLTLTLAVFAVSIYLSLGGFAGFVDRNSVIIVVGGTIAAIITCIPPKLLKNVAKDTLSKVFRSQKKDYQLLIAEIIALAQAQRKGDAAFEQQRGNVTDPFLRDAASLLFWAEAEISEEEFLSLLETKNQSYIDSTDDSSKVLKTMAKFPPAFGMMGTVLGLIALLQSLGSPDAKSQIGPAMAVALVTTLYGIAINNLLIIPIAERLSKSIQADQKSNNLVIEGLLLILQKKPTRYIEEKLKAHLTPDQLAGSKSSETTTSKAA